MFNVKQNRPPPGEAWIWLTKAMMTSDAWRSAAINTRRFVEFLLVEFMTAGGKNNGRLRAPYEDLEQIGIGSRLIAGSIAQAEGLGLVDCHRSGMRVATTYTLTWLAAGGAAPNDRWKVYVNPKLKPWPVKPKEQPHV